MDAESVRFVAGGPVQAANGLYLARGADAELLARCRAGDFVYILTARQLGKSSLMHRAAETLRAEGTVVATVDLQLFGRPDRPEQWYRAILAELAPKLGLDVDVGKWWRSHEEFGVADRFRRFLEEAVARTPSRIVLFFDEIDTTLGLPYTDDFFILIRALYTARANNHELRRLSFVLIGVATPDGLIKSGDRTPFNIGHRVDLDDFTEEEALPLLRGLDAPPEDERRILRHVLRWTGGHPYLTLKTFSDLVQHPPSQWSDTELDDRVRELFLRGSIAHGRGDSNLQFVRAMLTDKDGTRRQTYLRLYRRVLRGRRVEDQAQSQAIQHLKLSGVVSVEDGVLLVRNRIYAHVFGRAWVREHLPTNWRAWSAALVSSVVATSIGVYATMEWLEARAAAQRAQAERLVRADAFEAAAIGLSSTLDENDALARYKLMVEIAATLGDPGLADPGTPRQLYADFWERAASEIRQGAESARDNDVQAYLLLTALAAVKTDTPIDPEAIRRFREAYGTPRSVMSGHSGPITDAAFSPDGAYLATASLDQTVRRWDVTSGRAIGRFSTTSEPNFSPSFISWQMVAVSDAESQTNRIVASSDQPPYSVLVWDLDAPDARSEPPSSKITWPREFSVARFSSDGRRLMLAGGPTRILEWPTGRPVGARLAEGENHIGWQALDAAFSPDGTVAVASPSGVTVWRGAPPRLYDKLECHPRPESPRTTPVVTSVRFSEDGQWLVTAAIHGYAQIWDLQRGTSVESIQARGSTVLDAGLCSRDGSAADASPSLVVLSRDDDDRDVAQLYSLRLQGGYRRPMEIESFDTTMRVHELSSRCTVAASTDSNLVVVLGFDSEFAPAKGWDAFDRWQRLFRRTVSHGAVVPIGDDRPFLLRNEVRTCADESVCREQEAVRR